MQSAVRTALALALAGSLAAEVPVREVVLYKHGIGFFGRAGELKPGESARLDFKAAEMNDVLKSLTVQDSSGKVTGLRYDSSEPLERKLAEFPFQIESDKPALSDFLNQLSGAGIELESGGRTVKGAIISARRVPGTQQQPEGEQAVLLTDSGQIATFDLGGATRVKLTDPNMQSRLAEYLKTINGARLQEKRSVYIDSTQSGTRQIRASYMIPTPVWKSSYRLLLKDAETMLEGWAIVDNTTGEDWNGVQLALVSGKPISFISRLYEPRYRTRPVGDLAEEASVAPVVYENAMNTSQVAAGMAGGARRGGVVGGIVGRAPGAPPPPPAPKMAAEAGIMVDRAEVTASNIVEQARTREVGELFEYRFGSPVTVKKNESAMLPFLQQKIGAKKLLIYSDAGGSQHPMNAAEIANGTGKTLDGGPITVFDGGSYAGEALFETLKQGDKRLISYAVDFGTRVSTKLDSSSETVRELRAKRGVLTLKQARLDTTTYTIRNVDEKVKTLLIERPIRRGFKVLNQKPVETTASNYRFEVKLAPGAIEKFTVSEEFVYDNTVLISNVNNDLMVTYLENKALSEAGRKQLESLQRLKAQVAEVESQRQEAQKQVEALNSDQQRLRQNIGTLNSVSGQQEMVQRYARTLSEQEGRIVALREQERALREKKAQLEREVNGLIEKMEF